MMSPPHSSTPPVRPLTVDSTSPRTWTAAGFMLVRSEPEDRERLVAHVVEGRAAPWPAFVMVEASEFEAMAYRYDRSANDAGETWHPDEAGAWAYLGWEYEGLLSDRYEIPSGTNADDYVLDRMRSHVWKERC